MDNGLRKSINRIVAIFCICYPAVWLYLPDLALLFLNPTMGLSLKSVGLLLTVFCTLPIIILISKNLRQFWLWNLPFAAISGCYAAYIIYYHDIPYDGMWFDLWNISGEVVADLTKYFGRYSLLVISGFVLYCICLFHPVQRRIQFSKPVKNYLLLAALSIVAVIYIITNFFFQQIAIQRVIDQSVVLQNYPYGMLGMMTKTAIAFSKGKKIEIPPLKRSQVPLGREIYVFVIGEAERYDDWLTISQAMHSSLLTDPDIRIFNHAAAQANLTSLAMPLLMSGTTTMQEALNHPLWMQFVKTTGCTTGWITNATEPFDYPYQNDFYDLNIDRKAWVGVSGVTYDDVLLPEIQRALTQGPEKLCLVVHFIGQHFDYRLRYREDLARFPVNQKAYDSFSDPDHTQAFRNAYDNSIIQTNIILQDILAMLKKTDAISLLIYTADHGESFNDGGSKLYFHGNPHPHRTEIHVPFFIWANAKFQKLYPLKWQAISKNQTRKISNVQILPTFLDALSVSERPAYLADSLMQPYKDEDKQMVLLPSIKLAPFESLQP